MASSDLAAPIARDLLGSVSNQKQQLPPQVQLPPPLAILPKEPITAVPEEKINIVPKVQNVPAPPDQASQSSVPNAQSDPPVNLHRRLLSRLVLESQL